MSMPVSTDQPKPVCLTFFDELKENQNRNWFHANKARYEREVKEPMQGLLLDLNVKFASAGIPLAADPKRSISRINRDVRFSADKTPYKTYVSATMSREPGETSPGLVYLQFDPDKLFVGAGFYIFEPSALNAFRQAIADNADAWLALTSHLARSGHPLERADALKRIPKGFESNAGSVIENDLKLKAFVCKLRLEIADIDRANLAHRITSFASRAMPLLEFGWKSLA
jgi:uncharacterized protein (TIGR02453 family)